MADRTKKITETTSRQEKKILKVKKLETESKKLELDLDLLKKWQLVLLGNTSKISIFRKIRARARH